MLVIISVGSACGGLSWLWLCPRLMLLLRSITHGLRELVFPVVAIIVDIMVVCVVVVIRQGILIALHNSGFSVI